jgi:hypothetical protein
LSFSLAEAVMSEKKKKLVAYHEAGHAILGAPAAPQAVTVLGGTSQDGDKTCLNINMMVI